MKKVYLDTTQSNMCMSVFVKDAEVVLAGTTINAMSIKHKNDEYKRFAEEYDIHFIFEDDVPKVDFYTIPMVDIFAVDSFGGYIGSIGQHADLQQDIPICYVDSEKNCYLIAKNGAEFLSKVQHRKEQMKLYTEIEFFDSYEMARKKYEFLDSREFNEGEDIYGK